MAIVVGIVVVLALAVVALLVSGRRHSTTGRLSRETQKRDTTAGGSSVPAEAAPEGEESVAALLPGDARSRADDPRRAIESGDSPVPATTGAVPATTGAKTPVQYVPVDEDELGLSRRQFFNRSILATSGLGLRRRVRYRGDLVPLARSGGGVGTKIVVGSEADAKAAFDNKEPVLQRGRQGLHRRLPEAGPPEGEEGPGVHGAGARAGMEKGYVALYQKCVHLGCRVPWCTSSQWFECPCHGSEVQPGRREAGWPGAARPRPVPARGHGRQHHRRHQPDHRRSAHRHRHHRPEP